jgi:hypothetical protein
MARGVLVRVLPAPRNPADHLVLGAFAAVLGRPLAVDQSAGDGDLTAADEVGGACFGAAAEHRHVDVQGRLVALVVDRQTQITDAAAVGKRAEPSEQPSAGRRA